MRYIDLTYNQQRVLSDIKRMKDRDDTVFFEQLAEHGYLSGQHLGPVLAQLKKKGFIRQVSGGRNKRYALDYLPD